MEFDYITISLIKKFSTTVYYFHWSTVNISHDNWNAEFLH